MSRQTTCILFWSYKGGQGRTWACANMAMELALFQGARVLLADFDYRAPGLHHYFLPFRKDIDTTKIGFVEGLMRWYFSYEVSCTKNKKTIGDTYFDPETFKDYLGTYKMPDKSRQIFPRDDWKIDWEGNPKDILLKTKTPLKTGGLIDILTEIDLPALSQLKGMLKFWENESSDSLAPGKIWVAHCGNIIDKDFRKYYGEGYPWQALLDPSSPDAQDLPITFADAFYSALSLLSDYCEAEYVFVDLPAGVTSLTDQLTEPVYTNDLNRGKASFQGNRFKWSEPSAFVAVTTLSKQALEGTSNFFNGELLQVKRIPKVCKERRAMVLYNLINTSLPPTVIQHHLNQNADECKIDKVIHLAGSESLPPGGCPLFPYLGLTEFLFRFKNSKNPALCELDNLPEDVDAETQQIEAIRKKVKEGFSFWTSRDTGLLDRIKRTGSFWSEFKIDKIENPPAEISLLGEDVPSLDVFIDLLTESLEKIHEVKEIKVYKFNHDDLFGVLDIIEDVKQFKKRIGNDDFRESAFDVSLKTLKRVKKEDKNFSWSGEKEKEILKVVLSKILEMVDIAIVPHYLHGYLSSRGFTSDLSGLLGEGAHSQLKGKVYQFEEFCEYRNEWIALPFTALAKLTYSREELPYKRYRYKDLALHKNINFENPGKEWILTEAKANSLSLWYEWEQLLLSKGEYLLERQKGSDFAKIVPNDIETKERIFNTIKLYWHLIRSQNKKDIGKVDWNQSGCRFSENKNYKYWLGWSDWIEKLEEKLTFLPMPLEEAGGCRQPLEGWVMVFPGKNDKNRNKAVATICFHMMSEEIQRQFHERGGCSAFQSVLDDPQINRDHQWTRAIKETLQNPVCKGKTAVMPSYAFAIIAFLNYVIYKSEKELLLAKDEDELKDRFDSQWDDFYKTLETVRKEEKKCS